MISKSTIGATLKRATESWLRTSEAPTYITRDDEASPVSKRFWWEDATQLNHALDSLRVGGVGAPSPQQSCLPSEHMDTATRGHTIIRGVEQHRLPSTSRIHATLDCRCMTYMQSW